ncbi:MAG: autotransporter-associated beta strand repeat-containing protein, partial [Candidatus Accumulibacter sp.]|nr:autotransporter-associated beta strand repeat-containing protein [Accumulibacter sp.]
MAQTTPWNGTVSTTVNSTVIGFGGQQWVVVGNDTEGGVYSSNTANSSPSSTPAPENSITLLLKNGSAGGGYGTSYFNTNAAQNGSYTNYYNGSTLQGRLVTIAGNLPTKEQNVINKRDLVPVTVDGGWTGIDKGTPEHYWSALYTGDGMNGTKAENQLLWALSYPEWEKLSTEVQSFTAAWWFRSYGGSKNAALSSPICDCYYVHISQFAIRPAFNLNLADVLFTSAASGNSNNFSTAADQGSGIRLTFSDSTIATPTLTLKANNAFDFSDGTVASYMYVSGFLQGASTSHYYAQLATANSGSGSFALTGATGSVAGGTYIFHVFGEETRGYFYSGFAGESVDFQATIQNYTLAAPLILLSDVTFGLDGGTIGLLGSYTKTWTLGTGDNTFHIAYGDAEISGNIGGSGGFIKTGNDTLTLSGTNNTYTGATTISTGTLQAASRNVIQNSSAVTVDGTFDLNNLAQTINTLSGANTGAITLGSAALTVNQSSDGTFGGKISDSGSMTKLGTGKLTLTGVNTYTGNTLISAGTLQLGDGGTSGLVFGSIFVDNGGTLIFNRSDALTMTAALSGSGNVIQSGTG